MTWIIIGLGNPGDKYVNTRHNMGHMVIDELARRTGSTLKSHSATRTSFAQTRLGIKPGGAPGESVVLAKCSSYMNTSGGPTKALVSYFKQDPETKLLVIHDELDIPEHTLRVKQGGGEGGHNGLRSITSALGTKNYARLRVGVGRPSGGQDTADYVLAQIPAREREDFLVTVQEAADVAELIVNEGVLAAQNKVNGK